MGSRSKKDASKAIEQLTDYLRRDSGAREMLGDVSRYVGELRHEKAKLKSSLEAAEQSVASLTGKCNRLEQQASELRGEHELERSRRRQAEAIASQNATALKSIEDKLYAESDASGDAEIDASAWWRLFKSLRIRMPRAPKPMAGGRYVFDLSEIAPNLTTDELTNVGLLAVVCQASLVDLVSFSTSRDPKSTVSKRMDKETNARRMEHFIRWMGREWIAPRSELDKKVRGFPKGELDAMPKSNVLLGSLHGSDLNQNDVIEKH